MKKHCFTIIASSVNPNTDDFEDRFFAAGCDDATISVQKGAIILDFTREERNFSHAIVSAIRDVMKTGAKVEHIEPDHLVNASDIAKRAAIGRAAVSLYSEGRRGAGFPAPIRRIRSESPLWDWVEVAAWLFNRSKLHLGNQKHTEAVQGVTRDAVVQARIVRELNLILGEQQTKSRFSSHVWMKTALEKREQDPSSAED